MSFSYSSSAEFINRDREKNLHRDFLNNPTKRACKIIGMKGIGKKEFLAELKREEPSSTWLEVDGFLDQTNTLIDDVIRPLLKCLGIEEDLEYIRALGKGKKGRRYQKGISKELRDYLSDVFEAFDKRSSTSMVFSNLEELYNIEARRFFNEEISVFFDLLIHRSSFKSNKLYFISNSIFDFGEAEESVVTIELGTMKPDHIKKIMSQEFKYRDHSDLASEILEVDESEIDTLLCGHPDLAKRCFVRVAEKHGIDRLLDRNSMARPFFDKQHKIKYIQEQLLKKYPLTGQEESILNHIVLFTNEVAENYLRQITSENLVQEIEKLQDRFLLEKGTYRVPALFRDYILEKMNRVVFKRNHEKLGDYFLDEADQAVTPSEMWENCTLALYHYQKAGSEKEKELSLFYPERFLERAHSLYEKLDYQSAYSLYHWLYEQGRKTPDDLGFYYNEDTSNKSWFDAIHWTAYAICCRKLNQLEEAGEVYERGVRIHEDDFILHNSYIDYLCEKGEYSEAEVIYLKAKAVYRKVRSIDAIDYVAESLYAQILANTNREKEAIEIIRKRFATYKSSISLRENKKQVKRDFCQYIDKVLKPIEVFKQNRLKLMNQLKIELQHIQNPSKNYLITSEQLNLFNGDLFYAKEVVSLASEMVSYYLAKIDNTDIYFLEQQPNISKLQRDLVALEHFIVTHLKTNSENIDQIKSTMGNMQGDIFEGIIKEALRDLYPRIEPLHNYELKYKDKEKGSDQTFEYDLIVINRSDREIIVIEAKGHISGKRVGLGEYDTVKGRPEEETAKHFFNYKLPKFKELYPNPENLQFKACYITSASFTDEAIQYLEKLQDSRLKPTDLDIFYDGQKLLNLLEKLKLKNESRKLKRYFFKK